MRPDLPEFILNIELRELGIAAGLQDRVIQTYRGLVFMDFSGSNDMGIGNDNGNVNDGSNVEVVDGINPLVCEYNSACSSRYMPIDEALLPFLYMAHNLSAGV